MSKKELWKMFVAEAGENVFKCKDWNKLRKKLGLSWTDEDGWTHDMFFMMKDFEFEEIKKEKKDD